MATIHEYREQINHKLDLLELEATALEEDLHHTHEQVIQKYEGLKANLRDALVNVKQKLKDYKELTEEQRKQILSKIDELQINLALGRADTEQKINEQKQKIMTHVKEFEKVVDHCLKEKSTELTQHMLQASYKLDAEFAAMETFFNVQGQKTKDSFLKNKEQLIHKLHEFNNKLAEKSESGRRKSLQFEKEITQGLKLIKEAFLQLKD